MVIVPERLDGPRIAWAGVLGHELFHLWNGANFLRGEDKSAVEWFTEGFTEYYSSLSMMRTGLIDQETYFRKLEYYLSRYSITTHRWPEARMSLVDAGQDKQHNWLFVYGGGSTMALALDLDIRQRTQGAHGLDDVMRLLMNRFGEMDRSLTVQDILDAVNEVSGADYTEFFDAYIRGSEAFLDIEPYLAHVGVRTDRASEEHYLTRNPASLDSASGTLFEQWLGLDRRE